MKPLDLGPSFTDMSAPLEACDDAIAHYDVVIQNCVEEDDRLTRALRANQADLAAAQQRRQQWVDAQGKLQA